MIRYATVQKIAEMRAEYSYLFLVLGAGSVLGLGLDVVSREGWAGRPPRDTEAMASPVPYVVVHHTYIPGACRSQEECVRAVQYVQNMHMDDNGWSDIGYSFLVGGDARVYAGRGWTTVGAHAPSYNSISVGICFIGDYQEVLPPAHQLQVAKDLIELGVRDGKIDLNYTLLGHRQTRPTECPGQALYDEITTWPHYSPHPEPPQNNENLDPAIVTREQWKADKADRYEVLANPVPVVVIIHSHIPGACKTPQKCANAVKDVQRYHTKEKHWDDIAYNFVIGGDNNVYEGRGWFRKGAHSRTYNNISIGICIIGDYTNDLPSGLTLYETKKLISYGVKQGHIRRDYVLVGHRQLVASESPGERLLREIQTWPHYSNRSWVAEHQ